MDEDIKRLYELKPHERLFSMTGFSITRVPGGWIYENLYNSGATAVFVPFNNEFMTDNAKGE